MAPVKFANACAACHLLTFDKRFDFGVPHDKPEVIHVFLVKTFHEYIAAHADEMRVQRDPGRDVTGKPLPPGFRTASSATRLHLLQKAHAEKWSHRLHRGTIATDSPASRLNWETSRRRTLLCGGCRMQNSITGRMRDSRA